MRAIRRKRLIAVGAFTVTGLVLGAVLGALIQQIEGGRLGPSILRGLAGGTIIGCLIGVGEELVFVGVARGLGYRALNVARVLAYSVVIFGALFAVNGVYPLVVFGTPFSEGVASYLASGVVGRDLTFAVFAAVVGSSFLEVRRLHNPGDLRRFLTGRYRRPEEEDRVFLLADLEGSTGLAGRLGNVTYSELIRECYYDISEAILAWRGQVYQYVGDEVVVTWPFEQGVQDARAVRCFFDMVDLLEARRDEYEARYGIVPRFKASIHGGPVVTTWVGEAKKELAFHGDALNAAARMEAVCRELGSRCLISEAIYERIDLPDGLSAVSKGVVPLRGRHGDLPLWSIEPRGRGA